MNVSPVFQFFVLRRCLDRIEKTVGAQTKTGPGVSKGSICGLDNKKLIVGITEINVAPNFRLPGNPPAEAFIALTFHPHPYPHPQLNKQN